MSVNAQATVTLEIECKSHWSDDTEIEQVRRQAIKDATDLLSKFFRATNSRIKIVSDIKIKIVTFDV